MHQLRFLSSFMGRGPMLRSCGHPVIYIYEGEGVMRKFERFRRVTKARVMSILTAGATALLSAVLLSTPALAGEWRANSTGFWYINDDGSYPTYAWQWIDGDGDGVYQCFAFDESGYLMLNQTTPDGYLVGEAGAWFDGVTPVTRTYPVGTYVAPTPIEGLQKYGYASDGTRLVTSRTGSKTNASNKTNSSSNKNNKNTSTNKTHSSSSKNNSSVLNKPNAGNTASVSKKDLVTNKITVGKTDANGDGTTTGTGTSANASTTERVDPSTTAPSTSGFGPSVPKKNTSSSSASGPQTVITNSDGPNRGGSVTTENR